MPEEILAQVKAEAEKARRQQREEAAARARDERLRVAIDRVCSFTAEDLEQELRRTPENREFLEHWAQHIAHLGKILDERGFAERMDNLAPGPKEKAFAIQIFKRGVAGKTSEIVRLLEEAENISKPPAPSFSGRVNYWLRYSLVEEILEHEALTSIRQRRERGFPVAKHREGEARKRTGKKPIPRQEANILVREYLKKNPAATVKEIRQATEVSSGAISQSAAWKAYQAAKQQAGARPGRSPKTVRLTAKMQEAIGRPADPSAAITADEAAWQYLLEQATAQERGRLNSMNPKDRAEQIRLVREQFADQIEDEE
jgi:hypothetical protein